MGQKPTNKATCKLLASKQFWADNFVVSLVGRNKDITEIIKQRR